jgi:hypothetical protein
MGWMDGVAFSSPTTAANRNNLLQRLVGLDLIWTVDPFLFLTKSRARAVSAKSAATSPARGRQTSWRFALLTDTVRVLAQLRAERGEVAFCP